MDSQSHVIRQHIEGKREELVQNVNELERRVRGATDWKSWFRQSPGLLMGIAFGGGLLLSRMGSGRHQQHAHYPGCGCPHH